MSITTITGPMFSGKTTELVRLIDRKIIAGKRCLIVRHKLDKRYDLDSSKSITTHMKCQYGGSDIVVVDALTDSLFTDILEQYHVVGIDEGFLFENISIFCTNLANRKIDVVVSTIDSSFKQACFPEIGKLTAISEHVIKLSAICMDCQSDAHFTVRISDEDQDVVMDDGTGQKYKALCRPCMNKHNALRKDKPKANYAYID